MNAAQVRHRARKAVARREEQIEADEIEGGEINLVPYLDIVTNLLLFSLVSIAASFIIGEINTTLPNYSPASAIKPTDPQKEPTEERLQLVVSATKSGMLVWSLTGLEGTLKDPKARIPVIPGDGPIKYDYRKLNDTLYEIANRRWGEEKKRRPLTSYEIILQADGGTPYETVIQIMDNLRRRIPPDASPNAKLAPVTMPKTEPAAEPGEPPVVVEIYDPNKHLLFPDILFSLGFQ